MYGIEGSRQRRLHRLYWISDQVIHRCRSVCHNLRTYQYIRNQCVLSSMNTAYVPRIVVSPGQTKGAISLHYIIDRQIEGNENFHYESAISASSSDSSAAGGYSSGYGSTNFGTMVSVNGSIRLNVSVRLTLC